MHDPVLLRQIKSVYVKLGAISPISVKVDPALAAGTRYLEL